ncbi:MAG: hypothetical protein RR306_06090 [Clostridia bacterium]
MVLSQIAKKGDEIFQYFNTLIRKKRAVLDECCTDIVMVELFETATAGEYPAEKQNVSIQIDTYGGPAADPLTIAFTVNFRGDGSMGTFNPTTKKFTPKTV